MEYRSNEATINRPEGDRPIDAPQLFIDIPAIVDQLKDEKAWEKGDRNAITVFKGGGLTMVVVALQKKAEIVDKAVEGFVTVQVIKGEVTITTPEGKIEAEKKQAIVFRPGVHHSITADSNAILLLSNYSTKPEGERNGSTGDY